MDYIDRKVCAVAGTDDLEELYTFTDFPVFMGCTSMPPEQDLTADMQWVISRSSGLIQLKKLLPLDVLYPEAHGAGCIGGLWQKHHRSFAEFIARFTPESVLEIGGSHGILAKEYKDLDDVAWVIIEPNPSPVEDTPAEFIKSFFDDGFTTDREFNTLVHSHVFEHIYEPDVFMRHLSSFMPAGANLIFSVPNMREMLKRKYTNCINFEHTTFLTEPYIEYLLAKHGFSLEQKVYFLDDHSIFYAAQRSLESSAEDLRNGLYDINKHMYEEYVAYHKRLVNGLNDKILSYKGPVYLFGAHVFAQYLLAFGLDEHSITCLLDNDPDKQEKRLYGTGLTVNSPKILKDIEKPVVILKAGVYNEEIKVDIIENINPNTIFWE